MNELYQKSKKLGKAKGEKSEKANETQFPTVPEEEEPEPEVNAQETKKDK